MADGESSNSFNGGAGGRNGHNNSQRGRGGKGNSSKFRGGKKRTMEHGNRQKLERKQQAAGIDYREFKRRKVNADGESIEVEKPNPFSKEEIASETRKPKRKVAVMVGYSGTGYKGMQVNGDDKTIERDLFRAFIDAGAISKANADDPRKSSLARCARTDKGVHAAGNVISLKLIMEEEDIVDKINAALPEQIRVWGIQRTNNSYNCYQYCDSRWYEYLMPSYCLLPPHPQTYLGRKLAEISKEYGTEDELNAKWADVRDFWQGVEENDIKSILDKLDPETRATVLERVHMSDEEESDKKEESNKESEDKTDGKTEETSDKPAAEDEASTKAPPPFKPKHQLTATDLAVREVKAAYVAAKRRYRITHDRLQQLQDVLNKYEGTRNFHNYTIQKPFSDPSAKRHIKSFVVNPKPILINNTEWLSLKVHGQSFMMHQIRKMVGVASLMVRCGTPLDRIDESYGNVKMAIPKAPGLGLLLERPVFENYNRRAKETLGKEAIDFDKYNDKMLAFKESQIYQRIFDVEEKENAFHAFFNQVDQFKSSHFLWLSAGGLKIAELPGKSESNNFEEEDEDPEGGEG